MDATATPPDLSALSRKDLAARYSQQQTDIKALVAKGDGLTAPEETTLAELLDSRDAVKAELDKRPDTKALQGRVDQGDAFLKTPTMPGGITHAPATKSEERVDTGESEDDKFLQKGPFKSFGHFCWEVSRCQNKYAGHVKEGRLGDWNQRIVRIESDVKGMTTDQKAASGLNELTDSEGSSFVPQDFAQGIWARSMQQENLLSRIGTTPIAGNTLKIFAYADDSRADGSRMGGVRGYWAAEAAQYTSSKPTTRNIEFKLNKLTLLVWATEELLEDSPMALDAEISRLAVDEFTFKCNDALTRGIGNGMPLGYLNAGCKITQAAVSAQGAGTITADNIDAMWARRGTPNGGAYSWVANQAIEPQLGQLKYVSGSTPYAATWLYLPSGGLRGNPDYATLKGRPIVFTEQAEDLGTEGDIALIDWSQWAAIVKSTGIKQSVSMHLRFDYDETAFKFSFRADARPRWEKALTRYKGTNSLSPIITLNSTRT